MYARKWLVVVGLVAAMGACAPKKPSGNYPDGGPAPSRTGMFRVHSAELAQGRVPVSATCDGAGRAPQLSWTPPPDGTRSVAVIVTDLDAPKGQFTHWMVYNVKPSITQIGPGNARDFDVGTNGNGDHGWAAICPPRGDAAHRYEFHVYALDRKLDVPQGARRGAVMSAMSGHVLAHDDLVVTYSRGRGTGV